jgi:hypothetical protein
MLDSDDDADEILTRGSSSMDYGTFTGNINHSPASSHWTMLADPVLGYIDMGLDHPSPDTEDCRAFDHIFSPRPYTMHFPVITMETSATEQFFCESPESNHLLFPNSIDDSESCYGVFLSPRQSSDFLLQPNSCPVLPTASTMLTPKPIYPLPTWFH